MTKMKIGIMTFHWATNYGAILQTYALQQFLLAKGYDVSIINYKPKRFDLSLLKCLKSRSVFNLKLKINEYLKERSLIVFRNSYLRLTDRYFSTSELEMSLPDCDVFISGSDQIWNTYFTLNGDAVNFLTGAYFLSFVPDNIKKIGYAISLGTPNYPADLKETMARNITDYDLLSFRENSAVRNFSDIADCHLVCDPTLLLSESLDEYLRLMENSDNTFSEVFVYVLRNDIKNVKASISSHFKTSKVVFSKDESLGSWLSYIKNTNMLITNSYHGMIFAILFRRNFYVLLDKNNSMNDRFYTLLSILGLSDKITYEINSIDINNYDVIDWELVKNNLYKFVSESSSLLLDNLKKQQ